MQKSAVRLHYLTTWLSRHVKDGSSNYLNSIIANYQYDLQIFSWLKIPDAGADTLHIGPDSQYESGQKIKDQWKAYSQKRGVDKE